MIEALQPAFEEKQAIALSNALSIGIRAEIEHRTKDMATKQDLDLITAKFEASIERTAHRNTLWVIGAVFSASALIVTVTVAAIKFL